MSAITTHVLNVSAGVPAHGLAVKLELQKLDHWLELASGETNKDGRVSDLLKREQELEAGTYRLTFGVGDYFKRQKIKSFYDHIPIVFIIENTTSHYHVPLLLSPFGYSTYRGS